MKKQNQQKIKEYSNKEKAHITAQYYGFEGVTMPPKDKNDEVLAKTLKKPHPDNTKAENYLLTIDQRIPMLRHYLEGTLTKETQPAIVYYESASPKRGTKIAHLDIIGSSKSITEAMLIKTALAILKEYGHKNLSVEINSLGDKDSLSKFNKEMVLHFKKHLGDLPAPLRQIFMKDPLLLIDQDHEKIESLKETMPQIVSFLNDTTREHFKEVLEFLETMNIQYRITNHLIGHRAYSNNTVFEIIENADNKNKEVLAWGTRYNGFSKKVGLKRDVPGASVSILLKKPVQVKFGSKNGHIAKSRFYFIQLGFEAKLRSLEIIETLREAKISVYQSLSKDKLSAQLNSADAQNFPYLLIVGQKEAKEGTVLVREKETRSQKAVPIANLVEYLKKLPQN